LPIVDAGIARLATFALLCAVFGFVIANSF
jgi:hypothetical protein